MNTKKIHLDNKGQLDLVGNFLDIIKTQPWILAIIFLALMYATTITINLFGLDLNLAQPLNMILGTVSSIFGFGFDWRYIVIITFLAVPVGFILAYGYMKNQ